MAIYGQAEAGAGAFSTEAFGVESNAWPGLISAALRDTQIPAAITAVRSDFAIVFIFIFVFLLERKLYSRFPS
jgi:hypothetical protein